MRTLSAALGCIFFCVAAANAQVRPEYTIVKVQVVNASHHAIWVDISRSMQGVPWKIDGAFCVERGAHHEYDVQIPSFMTNPEMRVRAELKRTDCKSSNVRVLQAEERYAAGGVQRVQAIVGPTRILLHRV